jgi:hypothetical protein
VRSDRCVFTRSSICLSPDSSRVTNFIGLRNLARFLAFRREQSSVSTFELCHNCSNMDARTLDWSSIQNRILPFRVTKRRNNKNNSNNLPQVAVLLENLIVVQLIIRFRSCTKLVFYYPVHNSPLVSLLTQMNSVHNFMPNFSEINL